MSIDFPEISMTQFVVSFDEVETGIILNKDLERYIRQGECFMYSILLKKQKCFQ